MAGRLALRLTRRDSTAPGTPAGAVVGNGLGPIARLRVWLLNRLVARRNRIAEQGCGTTMSSGIC